MRFSVEYPDRPLNRLTTGFRVFTMTRLRSCGLFDYIEAVIRWHNRVLSDAFVLTTDSYPPFQLRP